MKDMPDWQAGARPLVSLVSRVSRMGRLLAAVLLAPQRRCLGAEQPGSPAAPRADTPGAGPLRSRQRRRSTRAAAQTPPEEPVVPRSRLPALECARRERPGLTLTLTPSRLACTRRAGRPRWRSRACSRTTSPGASERGAPAARVPAGRADDGGHHAASWRVASFSPGSLPALVPSYFKPPCVLRYCVVGYSMGLSTGGKWAGSVRILIGCTRQAK